MVEPDLSFIRPEVSLDEMRALDRRRLMAIVNGMIMRMSEWLGEMAKKGEEGLMMAEKRLDKAEVKLRLIETKLQGISIDEEEKKIENTVVEDKKIEDTVMNEKESVLEEDQREEREMKEVVEMESQVEEVPVDEHRMLVKDDPRYAKYLKMIKLGIQEEAVRLKMKSEGVDPSILDNPNAVSDSPVEINADNSSDESVGSFTDSE
ncbi:hypothetical protein PENTCL1PPCAC_6403 [Pristionchus entomophagus]|uniref:Uncharacterized protein n=1 Tax=Pristionchus entomophagus TaxID=358040 RepID=A0AAV5SMA3_9BILA|nr:hypothetical protein PENTCL1PPCAC_6403 [Pristionchus entomophagus]